MLPATRGTGNGEPGAEPPKSLCSPFPAPRLRRAPPGSRLFRLPPRLHLCQHFGATLSPWIELVRRRTGAPSLLRLVRLVRQPVRTTELVIRLEQVWAKRKA